MVLHQLTKLLQDKHIAYVSIPHSPTYTAQHTAEAAHIRSKDLAKTVIIKIEGELAMVVLPANRRLDLAWLRQKLACENLFLAREYEFAKKIPACEVGAMPPFGNLFGMKVWAISDLANCRDITFNAGSHDELIKISYHDWLELVHPIEINLH